MLMCKTLPLAPGFSFMECLFTLAIMSLLAFIAYPSYHLQMMQLHRNDAKMSLLHLANRLERYYFKHQTYEHAELIKLMGRATSIQGYYTLHFVHLKPAAYRLAAEPIGQQSRDGICQTFTLDQTGQKGVAPGPGGVPTGSWESCWA